MREQFSIIGLQLSSHSHLGGKMVHLTLSGGAQC